MMLSNTAQNPGIHTRDVATPFVPLKHRRMAGLLDRAADALIGARGCLLTFHRVATSAAWPGLPNRDFYLDFDFLDALLGHLRSSGWAIVTIEEAVRRARDPGGRADRFVNFSIDDTYRDTWELAVPLFRSHKVPVTLFVTTGIPDGGYVMRNQGLETVLAERDQIVLRDEGRTSTRAVATPEAKRAMFQAVSTNWEAGDADAEYRRFCVDNGADPDELHDRIACTWDMLKSFAGDPLVEIGGHTVTHPRISALDEASAFAELAGCRERLEEQLGIPVRHFAFPFGRSRDCGPRDFAVARRAGFASAATTRKGLVRPDPALDPFRLPRCTLNGAHRSLGIIEAHLTGASAAAARMLGRS